MADDAQVNQVEEETTGSFLSEQIAAHNARVKGRSMGLLAATTSLDPIYIPGPELDLKTPGALVGVNYGMATSSTAGLMVIVQPYNNMRDGDWIEVFWRDGQIPVASNGVRPENVGQLFPMHVPAEAIPGYARPATVPTPEQIRGVVSDLWFRVTRAGAGNKEESVKLSVLSRLVFPGGTDPQPGDVGHYNLRPPVAAVPPSGVIDEDAARKGVSVTIPAYPNMRAYDAIRLSWGGLFVDYTVQPVDVDKDVTLTVGYQIIQAAGDSDSLVLYYRIVDEVHNQSSDWSLRSTIAVALEPGLLPAPLIENPDPDSSQSDVIELDKLGEADLRIFVNTLCCSDPKLEKGDKVELTWTGITAAGVRLEVKAEQVVNQPGIPLIFTIPNAHMLGLGMGSGVASYVVVRGAQQLRSKRSFVSVIGRIRLLPEPELLEAIGGVVEPDVNTATVRVPAAAGLRANDWLILEWRGSRGTVPHAERRRISGSQAGREFLFRVDPVVHLAPLVGSRLILSYKIERRGLELPLDSEQSMYNVGAQLPELPAPYTVPHFADGTIKPGEHPNGIDALVPVYPNMNPNQQVHLHWAHQSGEFSDYLEADPRYPEPFSFWIEQALLKASEGAEVRVFYRITEPGKPDRQSDELVLFVGDRPSKELPAPTVLQAEGGVLDPSKGATAQISQEAKLAVGDIVIAYWAGEHGDASKDEQQHTVVEGEAGKALNIDFTDSAVRASNNGNVQVRYVVWRQSTGLPDNSLALTLRVQGAVLPLPSFVQAVDGNLNPDDVPDGVTVLIDASARLRTNDLVTIKVGRDAGSRTYPVTVLPGDAGQALRHVIPAVDVQSWQGQTVRLSYDIFRSPNGPREESGVGSYTVNRVIGQGTLRVFGARYNASTYRASASSRLLSAYNATTGRPLLAEWQYVGDVQWRAGTTWLDREPSRLLRVRSSTDAVLLNPANVVGTGNDAQVDGTAAFAAMTDNARPNPGVHVAVCWGNAAWGGTLPFSMSDVVEITGTRSAYAARLVNKTLVCWGNVSEGGTLPSEHFGQPFLEVRSNATAFVGRREVVAGSNLGRVVGWGTAANGASIPPAIGSLTDIVEVYGAGTAFAAKRSDNTLVAWGQVANGGNVPAEIARRTDNIYVKGNSAAFVVRRTDNSVAAWGHSGYGATLPDAIAVRRDIASLEGASARAFSVLTTAGQVLAWGAATHGGTLSAEAAQLTDVLEVTSTWHAFCARVRMPNGGGRVVAWGNATNGGTVPPQIAQLTDIVQVTGSAWTFAALRSTGNVVVWGGTAASGLDISGVVNELRDVRAIYANGNGFTALTNDGRVVTWGHANGGGNSSAVQPHLRGRLLTGRPDNSPNTVVASDNDLRQAS
ncbi:hypothetical protein [Pseudomonas sp. microsymbiont 2]